MSSTVARVATGGVVAVLGLFMLKFILGLFAAVTGLFMFFLVKVVPVVLIILIMLWVVKRLTRHDSTAS